MSDAQKQKIGIANKGQKRSDETKQKISEALKAYWATIPYDKAEREVQE